MSAFADAADAGAGSTTIPWWLDVETSQLVGQPG